MFVDGVKSHVSFRTGTELRPQIGFQPHPDHIIEHDLEVILIPTGLPPVSLMSIGVCTDGFIRVVVTLHRFVLSPCG